VLVPFAGIGTTAIASILLSRKYIGFEINKEYVIEARKDIDKLNKLIKGKRR
jgi:DNA modification methylase